MFISPEVFLLKYQKEVCNNLRNLLDSHSMNALDLARKLNLSYSVIHKLINLNSNPTIETLSKIAKYFNISIAQLIGDLPLTENNQFINVRPVPIIKWQDIVEHTKSHQDTTKHRSKTMFISSEYEPSEKSFAIVADDIFEPLFSKGTILFFDKLHLDSYANKKIYVIVSTSELVISFKKIISDNGKLYLKSILEDLPAAPISQNTEILAQLIQARIDF